MAETGLSAAGETNFFNLYPNPSADVLNLDIAAGSDAEILLEVFDVSGQEVISQKYSVMRGTNSIITDVNALKAGTYLLKIRDNNSSFEASWVFIKQ